MDKPLINPLTDEHCDCFNAILQHEREIRDLIQRCKDCGVNIGEREQVFNSVIATTKLLKTKFFPDRA